MHKTYELTLRFPFDDTGARTKESVLAWLQDQGVDSFVEGVIEGLDIDFEYGLQEEADFYEDQGGSYAPLVLCSFDLDYIVGLQSSLGTSFPQLQVDFQELETASWQEGWKIHFQPIFSERFCILPDWEKERENRTCIFIEPGMAFGTGQHASTQLCLRVLEQLTDFDFAHSDILDLGTGTGILAIATAKLGARSLLACDLDKNAVIAARANSARNGVEFEIRECSLPRDKTFDLVMANILFTVLAPMLPDFAKVCKPGGLLLLSGLVVDQAAEMKALAEAQGFSLVKTEEQDSWVAMLFRAASLPA